MGNNQGNKKANSKNKNIEIIQEKKIENKNSIQDKRTKKENIQVKKIIKENKTKILFKYNILFVGETKIGTKTSLIKRLKEDKFIENIENKKEIREQIFYEKDNNEILLYLIDTNTEKEKINLKHEGLKDDYNNEYYKNADCIIIGYDVTNKQSFEEVKSFWFNKVKEKTKTNLIYLLGNKIDLKDNIEVNENDVKKFANINKIKYFPISVKKGINIKNFFDDVKHNLQGIKNNLNNEIIFGNPSKDVYKIILLGDCGIGSKTSLIKALTCDKFDPNEDPTIYPKYVNKEIALKNGYKINFEIWDTPGQEKYRSINKLFIKNSDCVVLGYDITRIETF